MKSLVFEFWRFSVGAVYFQDEIRDEISTYDLLCKNQVLPIFYKITIFISDIIVMSYMNGCLNFGINGISLVPSLNEWTYHECSSFFFSKPLFLMIVHWFYPLFYKINDKIRVKNTPYFNDFQSRLSVSIVRGGAQQLPSEMCYVSKWAKMVHYSPKNAKSRVCQCQVITYTQSIWVPFKGTQMIAS